ncbi:hypothetical protein Pyn_03824 [Prunus yedoensis var. nudiflora]|uniref:Uncharacterized protein n=1 Tax=Prunus yedoensis var. nudiflora TaxID=2094558 RepID=A0A314UUX9_PRUYE|nr:hypothetical protein Pyn_03824 [Prunus yedoensis var. nudiflora]
MEEVDFPSTSHPIDVGDSSLLNAPSFGQLAARVGQDPNQGKRFLGATLAKASYGTHETGPARMPNQPDL